MCVTSFLSAIRSHEESGDNRGENPPAQKKWTPCRRSGREENREALAANRSISRSCTLRPKASHRRWENEQPVQCARAELFSQQIFRGNCATITCGFFRTFFCTYSRVTPLLDLIERSLGILPQENHPGSLTIERVRIPGKCRVRPNRHAICNSIFET